jgi:membrane-bound ClpP family serine protease
MSWLLIISLIVFGLLSVVLDFLFIPGGVVAIIGALMEIAGVSLAYAGHGSVAGTITLVVTLAVSALVIVLILNSKTWKKCALDTSIESKANDFNAQNVHVGAEGMTISRLAPSGKAIFNGETVEVASEHGLIDENREVMVVKVEGNKIFVKLK